MKYTILKIRALLKTIIYDLFPTPAAAGETILVKYIEFFKVPVSIAYIICLLIINAYAEIKEPVAPVVPGVIDEDSQKLDKKNNTEVKKEKFNSYDVELLFEDQIKLSGKISLKHEYIIINTKHKGFDFKKKIKWSDVSRIEIIEWKIYGSEKKEQNSIPYSFYPGKWRIITRANETYIYESVIDYLNRLKLTNQYGTTLVYTYFIDYWEKTGENSGFWQNSKSGDFNYHLNHPLDKVVRIIYFK